MRQIHTIADVPRRGYIHWGVVLSIAALAALTVGAALWTQAKASEPAPQATASGMPTPTAVPQPDDRFPTAPVLSETAWRQVDATWDLEVVAYTGGGPLARPLGDLAVYATPPGGERHLAHYARGVTPADLRGVAWDPEERLVLLVGEASRTFSILDMETGSLSPVGSPTRDSDKIWTVTTLGRGSDGRTYVSMELTGLGRATPTVVAGWDADGWGPVLEGDYTSVSPLSGDLAVVSREDETITLNVVTGEESLPFGPARWCVFRTWATATDFTVRCVLDDGYGGTNMSGSIATREPFVDLGVTDRVPYMADVTLGQIVVGTPIVYLSDVPGTLQARELGVATADGYHSVGPTTLEMGETAVRLGADTRWVLTDQSGVPIVIDAARGTMTDLRESFVGATQTFAFIPGQRAPG